MLLDDLWGRTYRRAGLGEVRSDYLRTLEPLVGGRSNWFTKEFFRTAREHLTEDGVLAQWIQTYSFTLTDYLMIVRTMHSEFPHFGIILLANGLDTVLLASNRPLAAAHGR